MNLVNNFVHEGLVNLIYPFTTTIDGREVEGARNFDTERTYNILMNKFKFGGLDKPGLYLDETVMRMCYTHRRLFMQLALRLIQEGKNDKAEKVLAYANKQIPTYNVPVDYYGGSLDEARAWALLGKKENALKALRELWKNSEQHINWYVHLEGNRFEGAEMDINRNFYIMQQINGLSEQLDPKWMEKNIQRMNELATQFLNKGGQFMF